MPDKDLENSCGKAVNEDKRVGEGLVCFLNFENTATGSVEIAHCMTLSSKS